MSSKGRMRNTFIFMQRLPLFPTSSPPPSLCLSGSLFLSLTPLFVAHLYFSADGVHGNSEVSLGEQVTLTCALGALQLTLT